MEDYNKSVEELLNYRFAGGVSIVDCQPGGFGRMEKCLRNASLESGVSIIAVTGFHKLDFAENPSFFHESDVDILTQRFINEIETGMMDGEEQLDCRAGLIKCAVTHDYDTEAVYRKLFEAASNAAMETGASIIVHMDPDADVFKTIDIFEGYGVDTRKIILCHLDRVRYDISYHLEAASSGVFLEYDTINRTKYHNDEHEIKLIEKMIAKGYVDNLLLSMDTTNKRLKSYGAEFGLDYILVEFVEKLKKSGIDAKTIERIMKNNPSIALKID